MSTRNSHSKYLGICEDCDLVFELGIGEDQRGLQFDGELATDRGFTTGPRCDLHRGEGEGDVMLVRLTSDHWLFDLSWKDTKRVLDGEKGARFFREYHRIMTEDEPKDPRWSENRAMTADTIFDSTFDPAHLAELANESKQHITRLVIFTEGLEYAGKADDLAALNAVSNIAHRLTSHAGHAVKIGKLGRL